MKCAVHKTILHTYQTVIENIGCRCAASGVHLNQFSWTGRVMRGREAEA
jgi:hypothetical protein